MKLPTFILSLAMLLPTVSLVAQEEAVPVGADDVSTPSVDASTSASLALPWLLPSNAVIATPHSFYSIQVPQHQLPAFSISNLQELHHWDDGAIYGIGSTDVMPGLGNFNSATVGITQHLGRFTVTGALSGYKYHINRNLYNDFGISGSVSYQIDPHFTISVFGNYSSGNVYDSPAAMPYVNFSCFGGSIRYQASETFGMELGVRRVFDPNLNRWQTIPIVTPTVNIGNCAFGIDVGGLLHSIINSGNYDHHDYRSPIPTSGSSFDSKKGSIPGSGLHLLPAKAVKPR